MPSMCCLGRTGRDAGMCWFYVLGFCVGIMCVVSVLVSCDGFMCSFYKLFSCAGCVCWARPGLLCVGLTCWFYVKNIVFYWSFPPPQSLVSTYFEGIFFRAGPLKNSFFAASLINIEYRQGGWGRASPSSSNVLIYLDTFEI